MSTGSPSSLNLLGPWKTTQRTAPHCQDRASRTAGWRRHLFVVPAEHGRQAEHAQPDLVEDAVGQDARQRCQQLRIATSAIAYPRPVAGQRMVNGQRHNLWSAAAVLPSGGSLREDAEHGAIAPACLRRPTLHFL